MQKHPKALLGRRTICHRDLIRNGSLNFINYIIHQSRDVPTQLLLYNSYRIIPYGIILHSILPLQKLCRRHGEGKDIFRSADKFFEMVSVDDNQGLCKVLYFEEVMGKLLSVYLHEIGQACEKS